MARHAGAGPTSKGVKVSASKLWAQERLDRAGRGASFRPLLDKRPGRAGSADLDQIDPGVFLAACQAALRSGIGFLLAPTSDGGAISVTVYEGENRSRAYCASSEEFQRAIEAM